MITRPMPLERDKTSVAAQRAQRYDQIARHPAPAAKRGHFKESIMFDHPADTSVVLDCWPRKPEFGGASARA